MKKVFSIQCSVFSLLLLLAFGARGVDLITATIVVTNTAGVTNLSTLTVNGDVRTWTTNVTTPATQILTNSTDLTSATNLFYAIAASPFAGLTLSRNSTNSILLRTAPGGSLAVTLGGTWGTVSLATNSLTAAIAVRVPYSVETAAVRTNVASGLVKAIDGPENTNSIHESSPVAVNLVGITNAQTISGAKLFTGVATLRSPLFGSPVSTNGVNVGNAFSSPGAGVSGEQFGASASVTANGALAVGVSSTASGANATAVGYTAAATAQFSSALGATATAQGQYSLAAGGNASADNSSALGVNSFVAATHTNSTAVGANAITTAKNQIMLGTASIDVMVNHNLTVGGAISGVNFANTNAFPTGSDIAFGRYALSSLANGNNAAVPVGTNVFVEVSGPSGAFTINGIAGGRDGKFLIIVNLTGFNMTIAHDSGTDPTAANRIYSMTGADRATTGNGAAMLIYSAAASRWILISLDL
jgi:hypothetical protein